MPTMLASKSIKMAVRLKKGWVSSSKVLIAKIAKKRRQAESKEGEVLSERTKRRVIAPYAKACASLSRPLICNRIGITSCGR